MNLTFPRTLQPEVVLLLFHVKTRACMSLGRVVILLLLFTLSVSTTKMVYLS
uniref:Uncharacterized protein n=1 Tax=Arundo donax TaxID=35708 RepID=A0A0A9HP68_ARUDO